MGLLKVAGLGCGAYRNSLCRTRIGQFGLQGAVTPEAMKQLPEQMVQFPEETKELPEETVQAQSCPSHNHTNPSPQILPITQSHKSP